METAARIAALRAEADRLEAENCTGISASWCPVHGDCLCPRSESGEPLTVEQGGLDLSDPSCPLHAPESAHGA